MKLGIRLVIVMFLSAGLTVFVRIPAEANCIFLKPMQPPPAEKFLARCGASSTTFGLSIGVPSVGASPGLAGKRWGGIGGPVVGVTLSAVAVEAMKDYVHAHRVPWPNVDAKRAKKHRKTPYNLYQLWMRRDDTGGKDLYKYGITMASRGDVRPRQQIPICNADDLVVDKSCRWRWTRVNISGWYRARSWEATYCARYVARKGHRPVGMRRCV